VLHLCPTCRRQFPEAGFCPFDGAALVPEEICDQRTLVSAAIPAQRPGGPSGPPGVPGAPPDHATLVEPPIAVPGATSAASAAASPPGGAGEPPRRAPGELPTQLEVRKRTFPLTPSPAVLPGTGEITQTRTRVGPEPAPRVRAPSEPAPDRPRIKVQSASDDPSEVLELLRAPRDSEYDKLIGQTLDGRYFVEKKIGEGGMGVVFSARHAVIERPLAIKVLKREAMRDTATIRRFVQEAKAASRIGHPNIVDVTDFGTTPDGMTYSVMEFVPGQTLGTAIRNAAPFGPARAMRITAQIARALAAAHDKGIVHRDLKPENVFLLDRDGRPDFVKIVDFGIAKVTPPRGKTNEPRLTRAGSVFGTPEYMAPEQAAGRSDTDGRVDIYALGVLLYEMICGRVPHRGDSMVRTLAMQMLDPIEPPSKVRPDLQIAPELEAIVMRALAKKREQRYQTMGELLEALDGILPPAVGQSVTGSPVYTLAAMPGADPGVVPSVPAAPLGAMAPQVASPLGAGPASADQPPNIAHPQTTPGVEPARSSSPLRRVKDEPEFTADDRRPSFRHVFTEEMAPARERRWPLVLLFALLGGGAAGAFALLVTNHRATEGGRDAAIVALRGDAAGDAATDPVPLPVPADAMIPDDADLIVLTEPDAGRRVIVTLRRDAGIDAMPETPNHRGTIMVTVLTQPEGAQLLDGYHDRGRGGTHLEEPLGSKLTLTCRMPGYKDGTVEVVFDGRHDAALCVMKRIVRCIPGLKNPFDDCEPAPPGTPSPSPIAPQVTPPGSASQRP
jgi:serine/threonine-protein kinase